MGLYRRKDSKIWWMSFTVNNRPYNKSTGTEDKEVAKQIHDILKGKIALGQWHPETVQQEKREYTFRKLAEKYWEYKTSRLKSQRSIGNEAGTIKMLTAEFGEQEVNTITTQSLEQLQSRLLLRNKPATVNRKFDVLKNMFTKAYDWEMVSEEVLKRVRKVKHLKMNNRRLRYLSKEECHALIDACDPHLEPIVITALNTGMRRGEILSLKWENVDLKHGFIKLDCPMTKNGERREIPVNDTLRGVLQAIPRRLDFPLSFSIRPRECLIRRSRRVLPRRRGGQRYKTVVFTISGTRSHLTWSWPGWTLPLCPNCWDIKVSP